jgi:hypothetical protein
MTWLDDPRRKLARADEHLNDLEESMRGELDARSHDVTQRARTIVTVDGGTQTMLQGLEFASPPTLPPRWALLIGDFASNARSALDHLAWHLMARNTWRASRARTKGKPWPPKLYFPIVVDRPSNSDQKKRLKNKLSPFRPSDRKHVAAQQPHRRGKLGRDEPLWLLNCIRNVDIHRELHTILASVPAAALGDLHRLVPTAQGGTEFYWPQQVREAVTRSIEGIGPDETVELTVQLEATFSPFVTFDHPGEDFHGREVLPLLHSCRDEVARIIDLFVA